MFVFSLAFPEEHQIVPFADVVESRARDWESSQKEKGVEFSG